MNRQQMLVTGYDGVGFGYDWGDRVPLLLASRYGATDVIDL